MYFININSRLPPWQILITILLVFISSLSKRTTNMTDEELSAALLCQTNSLHVKLLNKGLALNDATIFCQNQLVSQSVSGL